MGQKQVEDVFFAGGEVGGGKGTDGIDGDVGGADLLQEGFGFLDEGGVLFGAGGFHGEGGGDRRVDFFDYFGQGRIGE